MAPKTQVNPEVEEDQDEDTSSVIRPSDLAETLEVSPKALRGFLRREFPRDANAKNTSWELTEEMVEKATAHFTASDEDEVEEDDAE